MKNSLFYHHPGKHIFLRAMKYIFLSGFILILCLKCELFDNSEPEKPGVSEILSGLWQVRLEVYMLSTDLKWHILDSNIVKRYYTVIEYWEIDTAGNLMKQSVACDFYPYVQYELSTILDETLEFTMHNTTYKIIEWDSDGCIIQCLVKENERHTYHLSRVKNDYSAADFRDPYCGKYKGYKRTWMRGMGGSITETYDSNIVVIVTKFKCSPDQIRLNSIDVYKLNGNLEFGYNKLPDGIRYQGKFRNGNLLEITITAGTNEYISSYFGTKTN